MLILKEVSNPVELLHVILYIEGSGIYRLVPFKREVGKTKYAIVRVYSKKVEMVRFLSATLGTQRALEQAWKQLKTTYPEISIYHLKNGDIRVWKH